MEFEVQKLQGGSQQQRRLGVPGSEGLGGLECRSPAPAFGELGHCVDTMGTCMGTPIPGTGPLRPSACQPWVLGGGALLESPSGNMGWAHSSGFLQVRLPGALSTDSLLESVVAAVRLSPPGTQDREEQSGGRWV